MIRSKWILKSLLFLTLIASIAACESYDLEVQNQTDDVIDIYVDELYEGAVAPNNYLLIRNLSDGEHYIEAVDINEKIIVEDSIYLEDDRKWVIYESYYQLH